MTLTCWHSMCRGVHLHLRGLSAVKNTSGCLWTWQSKCICACRVLPDKCSCQLASRAASCCFLWGAVLCGLLVRQDRQRRLPAAPRWSGQPHPSQVPFSRPGISSLCTQVSASCRRILCWPPPLPALPLPSPGHSCRLHACAIQGRRSSHSCSRSARFFPDLLRLPSRSWCRSCCSRGSCGWSYPSSFALPGICSMCGLRCSVCPTRGQ